MADKKTATENVAKPLTLQQKFVELRKAVPCVTKKQHSDGVKYKFARINDVYELLTPAMNEFGVNFDIVEEQATRHDANGDAIYYHTYTQQTRNGSRIVWVYEADLTIRWTNADDPADDLEATLHAIGTNDGGPDKAKGSAWTYCLKYYLFEKFGIDQGEDDPDMNDHSSDDPQTGQNCGTASQNSGGYRNARQGEKSSQNGHTGAPRALSEAQISRMYRKGESAGYNQGQIDKWIFDRYKVQDSRNMNREQYEEACAILDNTAARNAQTAADNQGGNVNA